MKMNNKLFISIIIILSIITSFFVGRYVEEKQTNNTRIERCSTLVLFALDKVENGNLEEPGTMRALISNVYAAYQYCDDTKSANQLHDLWNYLIFESDNSDDNGKEITLRELNAVLRYIKELE